MTHQWQDEALGAPVPWSSLAQAEGFTGAMPTGPLRRLLPTYMMHPMDHTSTSKLCPFLLSTSGAM